MPLNYTKQYFCLIIIILFSCPAIVAQTAVYVCTTTGAWGYSYDDGKPPRSTMEEVKRQALKGCQNNGGTNCGLYYSGTDAGWYAYITGGKGAAFNYLVAWSKVSENDAEQRAREEYRKKGGLDPYGATITTWYVPEPTNTYTPNSTFTPVKPDKGYPEYLQGVAAYAQKRYYSAIDWYKEAAKQGSDSAMFNLANMYYRGEGTAKNDSLAMYWYRKAADMGVNEAMYGVAMLYYNGEGVTRNMNKAVEWLQKAAAKGNKNATEALKKLEEQGGSGEADFQKGAEAYQAKKYKEALDWMMKAADKGVVEAMFNLGVLYYQGEGTAKNDTTARSWYQKAAEKGHPTAMYNLGYMYEKGISVQASSVKALEWYKKAKDGNHPKAAEAIERIKKADDDEWDALFGW